MIIKLLHGITEHDFLEWGHSGYESQLLYTLTRIDDDDWLTFKLSLSELDKPYVKHWERTQKEIDEWNKIITGGHSYGAYDDERLVGIVICEKRTWNNTLYIENIAVAEKYRHKGIGTLLIEKVIANTILHKCRLVELETQNTNVPAITFYQKQGFRITGLNMKLYYEENNEIALFMTFET